MSMENSHKPVFYDLIDRLAKSWKPFSLGDAAKESRTSQSALGQAADREASHTHERPDTGNR